jgi:hypothetical protein
LNHGEDNVQIQSKNLSQEQNITTWKSP